MNMGNKYKSTLGVLGIISLFSFAVHFDFVAAASNIKSPTIIQHTKKVPIKKKAVKTSKVTVPQGTWHVVAVYNGQGPSGLFTPSVILNSEDTFQLTFKANSFCRSDYADPITNEKPYCEPITFNKDRTFTGGRLQAFGGFMKLNGSQLEFIEGGMGYTKYVLEKKK